MSLLHLSLKRCSVRPCRGLSAEASKRASAVARWSLCLVLIAFAAARVYAHNVGESYLYLQVYPERLSGRFEVALADLNPALGLSGTDQEITEDNLVQRVDFLQDYYLDHVEISSEQGPLAITFTSFEFLGAHDGFALLSFDLAGFDEVPEVLTIDYSVLMDEEPGHRGYLLIEHNWATGTFANENQITLVFSSSSRRQQLDLTSSGRLSGFLAVLVLGIEHMLLGFDHALFLVALLLPAVLRRDADRRWQAIEGFAPALRNVVEVVVAFMVAHSLTFELSALGLVSVPERLVEVAIAVSVTVAAANILWPVFKERIWIFAFFAGLFHGLGFAAAISGLGVLGDNLGLSLFAFNLGIEFGVIAIVAILFPVLFVLRGTAAYQKLFLPIAAISMILVSGLWVVERAFGLHFNLTKRAKSMFRKAIP